VKGLLGIGDPPFLNCLVELFDNSFLLDSTEGISSEVPQSLNEFPKYPPPESISSIWSHKSLRSATSQADLSSLNSFPADVLKSGLPEFDSAINLDSFQSTSFLSSTPVSSPNLELYEDAADSKLNRRFRGKRGGRKNK